MKTITWVLNFFCIFLPFWSMVFHLLCCLLLQTHHAVDMLLCRHCCLINVLFQPKQKTKKNRISEWAEFQIWKFLYLQKLAHGKKILPPKSRRPAGGKVFLPTG